MGKETEKILQILEYWQQYQENQNDDIFAFGGWLQSHAAKPQAHLPEHEASPSKHYISKEYTVNDQITLIWARLVRYTHLWSKKALQDLPINTVEEYGLLKSVQLLKSARKSDLVRYSLLESTTCFEMIKRLEKLGYLSETVDPNDKRSRLVSISDQGKEVIQEADQHMKKLALLLCASLDQAQKIQLLDLLRQLNVFHENLYTQARDKNLDDLMGLI